MSISTGLPQRYFRKSEKERVHDDGGNPFSVVNVELGAFENRNQTTDTAKTKQSKSVFDGVKRWVRWWGVRYESRHQPSMTFIVISMLERWNVYQAPTRVWKREEHKVGVTSALGEHAQTTTGTARSTADVSGS